MLAGVAVVLLTRAGTGSSTSTIDPAIERPEVQVIGVADLVPGFPDEVVMVVSHEDHTLHQVNWPIRNRPVQTPVAAPFNARIAFDRSGEWLATTSNLGDGGLLLTVGQGPASWLEEPAAQGFVWHDSIPGRLAWTTPDPDGRGLVLRWADAPGQPTVMDILDRGGNIAGFGEWGFVVASRRDEYRVYNMVGDFWQTVEGQFLGSYSQGLIFMVGDDVQMIDLMGVRTDLGITVKHLEPVGAVVSQDWNKVAIYGVKGVKVAPLHGEGEVTELWTSTPPPHVVWSSDSRFVLVPTSQGVAVIDTEEGGVPVKLLESMIVLGVGVGPGPS